MKVRTIKKNFHKRTSEKSKFSKVMGRCMEYDEFLYQIVKTDADRNTIDARFSKRAKKVYRQFYKTFLFEKMMNDRRMFKKLCKAKSMSDFNLKIKGGTQ